MNANAIRGSASAIEGILPCNKKMNTLKWVKRFRKSSRLRAVIGLKPQIALMNFNVEAWSMYRRKSPMKRDTAELDGLQTLHPRRGWRRQSSDRAHR